MKWVNDPIGYALYDYLEGEENATIKVLTDIDGEDTLKASYFFRELYEMPFLEKQGLQCCQGKILDIGAGAGCHSLVLQEWGEEVEALEISKGASEIMDRRGVKSILNIDIFSYQAATYDTLLMLMNGLGICGSLEGLNRFLLHAKKLMNPKAQIIFDSSDIVNAYYNQNGSIFIDLETDYYGIVDYKLQYKNVQSPHFKWLYIDRFTLQEQAISMGFKLEILEEGGANDYLGRLTLSE